MKVYIKLTPTVDIYNFYRDLEEGDGMENMIPNNNIKNENDVNKRSDTCSFKRHFSSRQSI